MIERVPRLTPVQVAAVTELMNAEEQRTDRRPLDEVNRLAIAGADAPPREHWLMGDPLRAYGIVTVEEVAEVAAATPEDATDLLSAIRAAHPAGSR